MLMAAALLVADDISIVAVPVIAIVAVVDISMDSIVKVVKVVFGSVDVWLMVGWLRMCWSSEFLLMSR